MKKSLWVALASLLILSAGFVAAAEKKTGMAKMPEHSMYAPADIKWMDAPPVLPAGAKAAAKPAISRCVSSSRTATRSCRTGIRT